MATVDNTLNLFVPIHLEAMVVNGNTTRFKDTSLALTKLSAKDYIYRTNGALGYYLEKSIEDDNGVATTPEKGVHLHWVMPDALRRGKHTANGALEFPAVPNRWLVVRTNAAGELKSWVVQSDLINPDSPDGLDEYNYIKEDATDNSLTAISIGKAAELRLWNEDGGAAAIDKLTIVAPGNPEFAASYTHCKNVFGFYDNMLDTSGQPVADGTNFTYQVYGWYTNKQQDPFGNVKNLISLQSKLADLSWKLQDPSALRQDLPNGTVCYAMVHTVEWRSNPQSNIPSEGINVGIGNTASEALASILQSETKTISANIPEKLLAAYQFKSLVDNGLEGDGLALLEKKVHPKSFLPVEAGVLWVVQPPEQKAGDNRSPSSDKSLEPFDLNVSADLLELNNLQEDYNKKADELASQQAEFYALKYKKVFSGTDDSREGWYTSDEWTKIINKIDQDILTTRETIHKLTRELRALMATPLSMFKDKPVTTPEWPKDYSGKIVTQYNKLLASMTAAAMKDFEVKRITAPQYYEPVDPAIVITGLKPSKKYLKNSVADVTAANDEGKLNCRTRYLLPNTLNYKGQVITSDLIFKASVEALFDLMGQKKIPAGIKDLVAESLLLNPVMANEISRISRWDERVVKSLILNFAKQPAPFTRVEDREVAACLPPADAVAPWAQPWNPLYLEWAVSWEKLQNRTGADVLSGWKFGGEKSRFDFEYDASLQSKKEDDDVACQGRTLLSSQFAEKVKSLNATINQLFKTEMFNDFMPMAQSLGGFSTQLIQRYNGVQLPIVNVMDEKLVVDADYELMGNQNSWRPMIVNQPFSPLRAGTMAVKMLRVIDSFGQVLNVYLPGKLLGAKPQAFKSSAGMRLTNDINKFELAPRIVQPARLKFDWVSGRDAGRVTDSDPATSPVCGWLLYNALDKVLVVYEASGIEVGYFTRTDNADVQLVTPMGSNRPPITRNKTLSGVMDFIRLNPTNFEGICKQIDTVTKRIQAKYSRQQLTMALPTGFPIAVVSTQFLIEIKGLAAKDQSWLGGPDEKKFKYNVTIGNAANATDGLVGYFMNNDYGRFMVSAGEKNVPLKFKTAPEDKFSTGELQKMAILMDPRTMITITSGLLPVGSYELPQHAITRALKKINIRILAAPIITPVGKVKLPLLKSNDVNWDFVSPLQAKAPLIAEEATSPLTYEEIQATEGWLTLVNREPDSKQLS